VLLAEDLRRIQLRLAEYFEKKQNSAINAPGMYPPPHMSAVSMYHMTCINAPGGKGTVITNEGTKEGTATKRAANELPYALEASGEWVRLRKCLSSSYHMFVVISHVSFSSYAMYHMTGAPAQVPLVVA
jgi:hypothetical protein